MDLTEAYQIEKAYQRRVRDALIEANGNLIKELTKQDGVIAQLNAEVDRLNRRIADLTGEPAYLLQRVAWHMAHGHETPEGALAAAQKELATVRSASISLAQADKP